MLKKYLLIFLMPIHLNASTFFIPDSDSATLLQLLFTSVSQLNELERLVSNAQKYTKKLEEYNQLVQDHYFRAQRTIYIAQNLVSLPAQKIRNLGDINALIRRYKSDLNDFKRSMARYGINILENKRLAKASFKKDKRNNREIHFSENQAMRSGYIKNTKTAIKLTAQNTGLTYKAAAEIKKDTNLLVKKVAEQNEILERSELRSAIAQRERDKFYQMGKKR